MANEQIRNRIQRSGFRHWQVAQAAGIASNTFCGWLRTDLTPERKKRIVEALRTLEKQKKEGVTNGTL